MASSARSIAWVSKRSIRVAGADELPGLEEALPVGRQLKILAGREGRVAMLDPGSLDHAPEQKLVLPLG